MTDNKQPELLDYIVGKTLGKGLTSTVKLGTHKKTGKKVALKILKLEKLHGNLKYMQAMEADIAALLKIKHPNVLNLLQADLNAKMGEKNCPVMVLELAENWELMDYLMYTGVRICSPISCRPIISPGVLSPFQKVLLARISTS
mmetsp:Transcript_19884/g.40215  ORF Transcript_19884/g.40215 Transcript_19884/m.40215 type:complete len:144 (+) Transcript_19884:156-587(+)